ncbi:MAG: glycosyltransferase family 2 protein, partial [Planctomycetota bacterium]
MDPLAWAALACLPFAALPALVFLGNLRAYRPPPAPAGGLPSVSVLIPARNEEKSIGEAIGAALAASGGIDVEIVALDDGSTDRTPEIVRGLARADSRVRLEQAPPLPAGWCGKQHACHVLASRARHDLLLFQDADVRLEPEAIGRLAGFLRDSGADLVSGVPRQQTGTILEMILIPMIHFVLLGFLPVSRMRQSRS